MPNSRVQSEAKFYTTLKIIYTTLMIIQRAAPGANIHTKKREVELKNLKNPCRIEDDDVEGEQPARKKARGNNTLTSIHKNVSQGLESIRG
jgi:hypothetical protein